MTDLQIRDRIIGALSVSMMPMEVEAECVRFLDRCIAKANHIPGKWIPATERLPENEKRVLVLSECRTNKGTYHHVTVGMHEDGNMWREDSSWTWDSYFLDNCNTYDEDQDDWKIPEGWFEYAIYNDDGEQSVIDDFVTHWMPLPEVPDSDEDMNVLTNGKRIRAMGDEELAKALLEASDAGIYIGFCQEKEECIHELDEGGVPEERCLECMMQWLRKPAESAHE